MTFDSYVTRRRFLSITATSAVLAGCIEEDESGLSGEYTSEDFLDVEPDYGDWFANLSDFEGTLDLRHYDDVRIAVGAAGGLRFAPVAIQVTSGTRIVWEWTGRGGEHDVVEVNGAFESPLETEAGFRFEQVLHESGHYMYSCIPHDHMGMRGAVVIE